MTKIQKLNAFFKKYENNELIKKEKEENINKSKNINKEEKSDATDSELQFEF